MKVRKLTLAERFLGVSIVDQNYGQEIATAKYDNQPHSHLHGAKVTLTINQIENGWIVHRTVVDEYGNHHKPTIYMYPNVVEMAEGLKQIEAVEKLTGSQVRGIPASAYGAVATAPAFSNTGP